MVTCTGHIGIHEGADGRTDVRMYVRTLYVRTDVHDVMAIKPNFLTSMGYHIFLSMVLRARSSATKYKQFSVHCNNYFHIKYLFFVGTQYGITKVTGRFA